MYHELCILSKIIHTHCLTHVMLKTNSATRYRNRNSRKLLGNFDVQLNKITFHYKKTDYNTGILAKTLSSFDSLHFPLSLYGSGSDFRLRDGPYLNLLFASCCLIQCHLPGPKWFDWCFSLTLVFNFCCCCFT